ncbi:hypothetical protein [Streptomyces sp. NBC_00582]|uniref:hypothetical protein n=1 Tax=Streptomyces sp. NBC_00582 TaxID=2975783 RepID=UPI002E801BB2|nr:hypothetical protein [Streptomyces sp. NBC_00582]WUB64412.1 hypothetical protein OG852_30490 [Streptomyces sp. NBC_00582]
MTATTIDVAPATYVVRVTGDLVLKGLYSNDVTTANLEIPVDTATDTWRTVATIVVPVDPGDILTVDARARVTSELDYPVGIGAHLWIYDCDPEPGPDGLVPKVSERPWTKIAPSWGMNVTDDIHHLPFQVGALWQVPADWPCRVDGTPHRIVVALRADGHSTAAVSGDKVAGDPGYTLIRVRREAVAP